MNLILHTREGAHVVVFVYVGAVAFIREFQGSFFMMRLKSQVLLEKKKFFCLNLNNANKPPKTANYLKSQIVMLPITKKKRKIYLKVSKPQRNGKTFGGRWRFSVSPPFLHSSTVYNFFRLSSYRRRTTELSYEGCYVPRF